MKNEEIVLNGAFSNEFLRTLIFDTDYNKMNQEYLRILEEHKKERTIENEAMAEFILKDEKRTQEIMDILKTYMNSSLDVEEPTLLEEMPENVRQAFYKINGLTNTEIKILEIVIQHKYNIRNCEIGRILGKSKTCITQHINNIEKKGFNIKLKRKKKRQNESQQTQNNTKSKKLTDKQQKVLDIYKDYDYKLTIEEVGDMLGISKQAVSKRLKMMKARDIDVKQEQKERKEKARRVREQNIKDNTIVLLSQIEEQALDIYERNYYCIIFEEIKEKKIYPITITRLVDKFSKSNLKEDDAVRVSRLIKYRNHLKKLLKDITKNKNISYNNIRILIDELLQNPEEDRTKAIEFVIAYEEILLSRGLERAEEPIYQLLDKHKVQLTRGQCNRIMNLLNVYEEKIKPKQAEEELEL